jgi:membrane-bound metal-dependent hydrolase YbcI (DUF457 family)
MNFGGHLMAGWLIGHAREFDSSERRFITVMSVAPDVDGLLIVVPALFEQLHRTFGHNVFFGTIVPLSAFLFFQKRRALRVLPFAFAALLSHYFLDLVVTGWWAFYPLWPVGDTMILMSQYVPERVMKYHLQISLGLLLFVATWVLYLKKHRTPLETISVAFDRFVMTFVTLPFQERCSCCTARAFYRCAECGKPVCGRHSRFKKGIAKICPDCDPGSAGAGRAS